ncbi:hypothetical protein BpHYR1_008278 [Brachionus plicatilis]|uniref:Uncharacterized protein n=1 Tax=Brachionus plicatilis TaxID=10195 RepID=A0A3M7Q1E5_BRAPC|nr:hypothetical protein BpHYR1_008278 [Brachionus plicatilis]
MMQSLVLQ